MSEESIKEGRISHEEFVKACKQFEQLAKLHGDVWSLVGDENTFGESYLTTTFTRRSKSNPILEKSTDTCHPNNLLVEVEDAADSSTSDLAQILQFRYDVVFSVSYGLPTLYFMISRSCGKPLSLEEMLVEFSSQGVLNANNKDLWSIVSMQDHPILNVPFFSVHPCKNWDLLKECFSNVDNPSGIQFLVSWLSVIGNHFGLNLPVKYYNAK